MNRRHKVNWRKTRRESFAFASLEPRRLLAGDVTTLSIYSHDFVGPVPAEVADVGQTETATSLQKKVVAAPEFKIVDVNAGEISCTIEDDEQSSDNVVDESSEYHNAECSPTIMGLDAGFTQGKSEDFALNQSYRYDTLGRSNVGSATYEFSLVGNRVVLWDAYRPGNYNDQRLTYTYTIREFDRAFYNGATNEVGSAGQLPTETISIELEREPLNPPINSIKAIEPVTEGKYFGEQTNSSLNQETAASEFTQVGDSSTSIGVISQRQMFALVEPDAVSGINVAQDVPSTSQLQTRTVASSLATVRVNVASALDIVGSRDSITVQSNVASERILDNHVIANASESSSARMISVHEMMQSESAERFDANRKSKFASASQSTRSTFSSMLYQRIFDPFSNVASASTSLAVTEEGHELEYDHDDLKFARSIQILESAIILIGLPSSRICREEERSLRKKSV